MSDLDATNTSEEQDSDGKVDAIAALVLIVVAISTFVYWIGNQ